MSPMEEKKAQKQIVVDTLRKMVAFFSTDPRNYTQGTLARDAAQRPVRPDNPDAICFCASGFIAKELGAFSEEFDMAHCELSKTTNEKFGHGFIHVNDDIYGYPRIIEAATLAADKLEKEIQ